VRSAISFASSSTHKESADKEAVDEELHVDVFTYELLLRLRLGAVSSLSPVV